MLRILYFVIIFIISTKLAFSHNIQEDDYGYVITSNSGKIIKNTNDESEENYKKFTLLEIINNKHAIFKIQRYENIDWQIVNLNSAKLLELNAQPIFSPDYKMIAAIIADEVYGSSIAVFEVEDDKYKELLDVSSNYKAKPQYSNIKFSMPTFHSWKNNYEIRIIETLDYGAGSKVEMMLSYDIKNNHWEYKEQKF